MFKINPTATNNKIFYLKDTYQPEETFNYDFEVYNDISKTGFLITIQDVSPFVSGLTNNSTLITGITNEFYPLPVNYLNSYPNKTFIFNNIIQISGANYEFYDSPDITETASCELNGGYVIALNDNTGKIVVVDEAGNVITGFTFSNHNVVDIDIIGISSNKVVLAYFDSVSDISVIKEISIVGSSITQYNSNVFYNGHSNNIKINKLSDSEFILTYTTPTQGIIQKVKLSNDHIFSVGFPFIFNDDITLYSNSVYQNENIVVIFYDIDDQLKVKNCRIYGDYIGIGLPSVIKSNYCYDLGIGKLDDNYVYVSYYNADDILIYTSLLKINNDTITVIDNAIPIEDWNAGLQLTTISNTRYMLSYTDMNLRGVYRYVDISGGTFTEIEHCDYNEFNIDISHLDYSKNLGHNAYWIYYNNEIVEKGVCYINETYDFTYNV